MSGTERRSRRRHLGLVLGWIGAPLLLISPAALPMAGATFTASSSVTANSVTSADVAAPSGFGVTQTCTPSAIAFRAATSASSGGTGALTLSVPAGTQAGDVLIAHVTNRYDGSAGIGLPGGGWTLIGARTSRGAGASTITGAVYWKLASASEPATVTFTLGGGGTFDMAGGLAAYSGVDPTTPVNAVAVSSGSSANLTTPSVNTTVAGTRLTHAITKRTEAQLTPTGAAERWRVVSPSGSANQGSTVGDESIAGTGSTGSRTASGTATTDWIVHTFALQPAPSLPSAALTWTGSPTSGATGYAAERVVSGGVVRAWTVTPISATSTTDGPLTNGTAYTYRLWAYSGTWVSPTVTVALTPSC